MDEFARAVTRGVVIADGAMGTMLYERGAFVNQAFDALNVTAPDLVEGIHRDYQRAGAQMLETNTFGANRARLEPFGLGSRVEELNRCGVQIARRVAGNTVYVAGAIGPSGLPALTGTRAREQMGELFREQAAALSDAGVDLFVLETFRSVDELRAAVLAVRATSSRPIVAQMSAGEGGALPDGTALDRFVDQMLEAGATMLGLNCGTGPAAMLDTIDQPRGLTDVPLAAQPNAGPPRKVDGRMISLSSPDYFASYARRFVDAGVTLVGGCCGTTPVHTERMASSLASVALRRTD